MFKHECRIWSGQDDVIIKKNIAIFDTRESWLVLKELAYIHFTLLRGSSHTSYTQITHQLHARCTHQSIKNNEAGATNFRQTKSTTAQIICAHILRRQKLYRILALYKLVHYTVRHYEVFKTMRKCSKRFLDNLPLSNFPTKDRFPHTQSGIN